MKSLALGLLAIALLLLVLPPALADRDPPVRFGAPAEEDDDDGGGSKFDDPDEEEEEEKVPDKPVPATWVFKDYRLEMEIEDSRFWKYKQNFTPEELENGAAFHLTLKLPKSDDPFDSIISGNWWQHSGGGMSRSLTFPDGSKISPSNYKKLCEKLFEIDQKDWKDPRDVRKPRKTRLSRETGKAYKYSFVGQHPTASIPLKKTCYFFKFKDRTYRISILYTTTSAKNEKITEPVEDMLRTIREYREKRRR